MTHPPTISVIIPLLNNIKSVLPLVEQLSELNFHQIIIADGGSTDGGIEALLTDSRVEFLNSPRGRGIQICGGTAIATGDIFWILHADSVITENVKQQIITTMKNPKVSLGCFHLKFSTDHPILKLYEFFSRFDCQLTTFGDQGYFFRQRDYQKIGGCSQEPLFEDVDLRRKLKKLGIVQKSNTCITTSAERFMSKGLIKTQLLNVVFLTAYSIGVSPKYLAKIYYS
ncbi:TIGR04283 family arsenosugar biosynthesis glycosyltransferase [Hirschia maritima]|uniref:TIGR04283 family arsenosugar biosynthesis glycosyltransferase n=1 Tax=Hirschia maritima TaxID=1121961 RepID=UPI0003A66CF7|nr:TIGR04283 family arsenosugar biosynthesis glycosyltransferase [Hirschia maritima]